ncbi:MAG: histidine kinase [Saprospiraceae bacterium]|nr:histidine kinase [Saprospiraceae bacterium]
MTYNIIASWTQVISRVNITCIILFFSIFMDTVRAQDLHTLWFHPLNAQQGLSQSFNWYVYHDSHGLVWVSSLSGLNKFDGTRVRKYFSIPGDTTSLFDENIYSEFFEDRQGNIWFSTVGAAHCYVRKHDRFQRFYLYDKARKKIPGEYKVQYLEQDSFLWVSTGVALYRINVRRPYQPAVLVSPTVQFRFRMEADAGGAVRKVYAFGMTNGLEVYSIRSTSLPGNQFSVNTQHFFPNAFIREVWPEAPDRIWLASNLHGVTAFNPVTQQFIGRRSEFIGSACSFAPWKNGYLIIVVRGRGIFLLDKNSGAVQPITCKFIDRNDLAVQSFKGIYLDRDDNIWVTDENNGLHYASLHKNKFVTIPKFISRETSGQYSYWAIEEDLSGNIWVAASPGGVFLLNNHHELVRHLKHQPGTPNSLPSNWVYDILVDSNNDVYIATSMGLALYDSHTRQVKAIHFKNGKNTYHFIHLHLTRSNRLLAVAENGGVFEVKGRGDDRQLTELLPSVSGSYQSVYEDANGNLYLVRDSEKICVFQLTDNSMILMDSMPVRGLVNGIHEDMSTGKLFFATANGLVQINKSEPGSLPTYITEQNGLPGKFVGEILAGPDQHIWLGTNNGLALYNSKDASLRTFDLSDGVQSKEFHITAALKRRNGELWFGGSDGITIVPANGIHSYVLTIPQTIVTDIKINDEKPDSIYCAVTGATNVSEIRHLVLPYEDNTVSFEFVAIEYSDPGNNRLWYMLEGEDHKWVEVEKGQPGFARYSNLSHGEYKFWLKAVSSDGVKSPDTVAMILIIEPPWYLTWWFISLAVLSGLALVYAIYRVRVAQIRKEAKAKQQIAETETAILRLQMNPHFIFNSMNSINAYILKNDINTASEYLGRFSGLMRKILNLAAYPYISVSDEINLLDQYLQTEAMRFEKKFSYSFEVDRSIDQDETIIPTMILQPFAENAIWHGLLNKKGEGTIKVSFNRQNNSLLCSVEDNGIGRAAAEKMKNDNTDRESKALSITRQRLKILETETGFPARCKIIDLKDQEGQPLGTKVILELPLL